MAKVNVQWVKEKYDVTVESSDGLNGFQALLFSLTNVPPARQKLMIKGKMIKDDASVSALKDGDKLILMGTADAPPAAPDSKIVFLEDMSDAQKIGVVKDVLSAGLQNLGNTCYLASTLQCLRAVPELKEALKKKALGAQPATHDPNHAVVRQLGNLFREMDQTTQPVTPMMFTTVFRSTFPQFAETNNEGHWMQQDAEEALIQLMNCMSNILKQDGATSSANTTPQAQNTIDEYFGAKLETVSQVKGGGGSEAPKITTETYRRLKCFIDDKTNFLFQGLKSGLTEDVELRGLIYERTQSLLTLPRYLTIQMMRFGWRNDTKQKSKILRRVDFPFKLDVMEFAHPTLKHQLGAARTFIKEEQDAKLGLTSLNKKAKTEAGQTAGSAPSSAAAATDAAASSAMEVDSTAAKTTLTTTTSGSYELYAIVTHKGRTSDSGHYVSWTRSNTVAANQQPEWLKFDDEKVTQVTEDDIKALAGGGDNHVAYLLFYRRIDDSTKFIGQPISDYVAPKEKTDAAAPAAASSTSSSSVAAAK